MVCTGLHKKEPNGFHCGCWTRRFPFRFPVGMIWETTYSNFVQFGCFWVMFRRVIRCCYHNLGNSLAWDLVNSVVVCHTIIIIECNFPGKRVSQLLVKKLHDVCKLNMRFNFSVPVTLSCYANWLYIFFYCNKSEILLNHKYGAISVFVALHPVNVFSLEWINVASLVSLENWLL